MTNQIGGYKAATQPATTKKQLIETLFGTFAFCINDTPITGFLTGENTIEQYGPATPGSAKIPQGYGFSVVDTGGKCTAWRQDFELNGQPVYMVITDTSGMTHAVEAADRLLIGVYDQSDQAIKVWEQANWPLTDDNLPVFVQT
jgi:hypothetical protein